MTLRERKMHQIQLWNMNLKNNTPLSSEDFQDLCKNAAKLITKEMQLLANNYNYSNNLVTHKAIERVLDQTVQDYGFTGIKIPIKHINIAERHVSFVIDNKYNVDNLVFLEPTMHPGLLFDMADELEKEQEDSFSLE